MRHRRGPTVWWWGRWNCSRLSLRRPCPQTGLSLLDVLRSLETHPHVQRLKLRVDYNDAWQVGYSLLQLLPLEESLKYELLGLDSVDALLAELHALLNQISGAE